MKSILQPFRRNSHKNHDRYHQLRESSLISSTQTDASTSRGIRGLETQIQLLPKQQQIKYSFLSRVYFTPESSFIIFWQLLNLVLIYVYFIEIPITIAFEHHRKEEESEKIFEEINIPAITIFILNIFITLKTAYYKEGILISEQKEILKNYFIYSFAFDFLSITSICVYQFSEILQSHKKPISYRFIVILFYLKIPEIFAIEKSIITNFDLKRRTKAFLKLFLLLMKIFLVCNVTACGFFYLSDSICPMEDCYDCCWVDQLWILNTSIRHSVWTIQYMFSLYWASTTMISIGYGDITPLNQSEVMYTIGVQFVACFVFAFSINEIWSIVQEMKVKKNKIHHRLNIMNIYMRDKDISLGLKSRINAYLAHFYHTKNLREKELENEIIGELTPSLRKELFFQSYGLIFQQHPIFNNFSDEFLGEVSYCINEVGYFEEELIWEPNQKPEHYSLYYLAKGSLEQYIQLGLNTNNFITLEEVDNACIGGVKQFLKQTNYQTHLMARKYSLLYRLDYDDWIKYLKKYDEDWEKFMQLKHQCLYSVSNKVLRIRCQLCQSQEHTSEECFSVELKKRHNVAIQKYLRHSPRQAYNRHRVKSSFEHNISYTYYGLEKKLSIQHSSPKVSSPSSPLKFRSSKIHAKSAQKQRHTFQMEKILEKKKMKQSIWTSLSDENEERVDFVVLVDKVKNYENYHHLMNSSNDLNNSRRTATFANIFERR